MSKSKIEVTRSFPAMGDVPQEKATKRWYDWATKDWCTAPLSVQVAAKPFAKVGGVATHFLVATQPDGTQQQCVAKSDTDRPGAKPLEADVMMRSVCHAVAEAFNSRKPPKPVTFADLYMIQRDDGTWWSVETYLEGSCVRYNDNAGFVAKSSRNTPQAFSHFSYEFMEGRLMIVDIKGVGDRYTNPQVHTLDGHGYGPGNLGEKGIQKFINSHWCNTICTCLHLEFHAPKTFGLQLNTSPLRTGTCVTTNPSMSAAVCMKVSDFVGSLQPATHEELTILGLSAEQYSTLVSTFKELDKDATGFIGKDDLLPFFQKATGVQKKDVDDFVQFREQVAAHAEADGGVSFRWLVLAWTDHA